MVVLVAFAGCDRVSASGKTLIQSGRITDSECIERLKR
jgi:hypothetical protein